MHKLQKLPEKLLEEHKGEAIATKIQNNILVKIARKEL